MEPLFRRRPGWLLLWLGVLVCATPSAGQPQSRTEEIQSARQQKAARLQPEKTSGWVKRLMKFSEPGALESFLQTGEGGDGFQPLAFGGVRSGHGWSVGIGYAQRNLAGGRVRFSSKARVTLAKAYLFDVKLVLPRLAHNRHFLELQARHENSPRMDYYGRGPDSVRSQRTSYRLEDTGFDITTGVKPIRRLRLGVTGGYYAVNTGRGQRPGVPSTEEIFRPETTPGIDHQTSFLRAGAFAEFDWRDIPGGAQNGGYYLARLVSYSDRKLDRHDFRRLEVEASQYFPYLNQSRVIALSAASAMTFHRGSQTAPSYLQPYLGSSHRLRGFRRYRFHDDNLIHFSAEHRWDAFSMLDVALFVDAGKVAPKRSQLNLHNLEYSAGFGFRFTVRSGVFMRIDTAFSREGVELWWSWSDAF